MPAKTPSVLDTKTECAIILELLNRPNAISITALHHAVDSESTQVEGAVRSLAEVGLLVMQDERVRASAALERIDALGMISV
jgi:predicted transcriptional regulator